MHPVTTFLSFSRAIIVVLAAGLALTQAPAEAQLYRPTELGTLGGGQSAAKAINPSGGTIVGDSRTTTNQVHAFRWVAGSMTDLGTLGGPLSQAADVNDAGLIVGTTLDASLNLRAFVYDNDTMIDLGTLGGQISSANAINENNQIVGSAEDGNGEIRVTLWEKVADQWVATDLGTLGGEYGEAYDINDSGVIVGASSIANGDVHAFSYENDTMNDLGTLGGTESVARSINSDGDIVGYATDAGDLHVPAIWATGGSDAPTPLALLNGGGDEGEAHAIDDQGRIVGEVEGPNGQVAVIWIGGAIETVGPFLGVDSGAADVHGGSGRVVGQVANQAVVWQDLGPYPVVTDLGTLGGSTSVANAVNASGQVTGYAEDGNGALRAFFWENNSMSDIGDLGGGLAIGHDINDAGHIVGIAATSSEAHAFLWDGNTMTDLTTLGGFVSTAFGINNNGVIVGQSEDSSFTTYPFVYESGQMLQLPTLGGPGGAAYDINDDDEIVGWSFDESLNQRPCRWFRNQSDWVVADIGDLGGDGGEAFAISPAGNAVGNAQLRGGNFHAFRWRSGFGMDDLGTGGGSTSQANDIASDTLIVGEGPTTNGQLHALLFDAEAETVTDGNDLVDYQSGWELLRFNGVNGAAQVVGQGRIGGNDRAFLLQLPAGPSDTQIVDFTIPWGSLLSGDLQDLLVSDDNKLRVKSQFGFQAIEPELFEIVFAAVTSNLSGSTLDITLESRITNPGGTGTLRLRNWSTTGLETKHQFAIGTQEITVEVNGVDTTNHIRQSDGRIELAFKAVVITLFSATGFEGHIDFVDIQVN